MSANLVLAATPFELGMVGLAQISWRKACEQLRSRVNTLPSKPQNDFVSVLSLLSFYWEHNTILRRSLNLSLRFAVQPFPPLADESAFPLMSILGNSISNAFHSSLIWKQNGG